MKIIKLLPLLLITSSLFSQNYFADHGDICKVKASCPNEVEGVTKLQHLLGSDRKLQQKLKVTGQFDQNTFDAIVAFQKQYNILPSDGWVGKTTKIKLDEVYGVKSKKVLKKSVILCMVSL